MITMSVSIREARSVRIWRCNLCTRRILENGRGLTPHDAADLFARRIYLHQRIAHGVGYPVRLPPEAPTGPGIIRWTVYSTGPLPWVDRWRWRQRAQRREQGHERTAYGKGR